MTTPIDIQRLVRSDGSRIVLVVVDGLGGYPHPERGESELEAATLPNLDSLAQESACGLTVPILPGITPGSGPGHLALFGYEPTQYRVGRGVMEALGIGLELANNDVAARGNFCTLSDEGRVLDRRTARIPSERSETLVKLLDTIELSRRPRQKRRHVSVHPVRDHRFVVVFHEANDATSGVHLEVSDTDPGTDGYMPLDSLPYDLSCTKLAEDVNNFVASARTVLKDEEAQGVVLRGISNRPKFPSFAERFGLRPAAIAAYPMYRGLAQLVGMDILETGSDFIDEVRTLRNAWGQANNDFFFIHYKPADATGEDGNFEAKVSALEAFDSMLPEILHLKPDVLVIAGDHSTPAVIGGHSWHPVPLTIRSRITKGDGAAAFTERAFATGSIGTVQATSVMTLAMAHAGRLNKYGP